MSTTDLLSTLVTQQDGVGWTRTNLSGEKYMEPIVEGVIDAYKDEFRFLPEDSGDPVFTPGNKVTLLRGSGGAFGHRYIDAIEGTLFAGSRGLGILPKGNRKNGNVVANVLDALPGYQNTGVFTERIGALRDRYPQLTELTQERLEQVSRKSSLCDLAVFGKWFGGPAIWFISEYHKADDIVEGYLAIHPQYGDSEHGSVLGQQILHGNGAEVVGFTEIPFKEAIYLDYDQALTLVAAAGKVTA